MDFKRDTAAASKRSSNKVLITKPDYTGSVWKPKWAWENEARVETHVRFVGPLTDDKTNFLPSRYGPEENEFGQWINRIPLFTGGMGEDKVVSFISALEDPERPGEIWDPTMYPSPADNFVAQANKMAKQDPAMKVMLLEGSKGKPAALPKYIPTVAVAQVVMLRWGVKDYYKSPICPALFYFSSSACDKLCDLLNKETENYRGDPLDLKARFVAGDIVAATTGRVVAFYNAQSGIAATNEEVAVNWTNTNTGENKSRKSTDFQQYTCDLRGKYGIPLNSQGQLSTPEGKQLFTPWVKVLRFLTEAEMVDKLCQAYAELPGLLMDCLRVYKHILPKFVTGDTVVTVAAHPFNKSGSPAVSAAKTPGGTPVIDEDIADVTWGAATSEVGAESGAELSEQMIPPTTVNTGTAPTAANAVAGTEQARVTAAMAKLAALRGQVGK